MSSILFKNIKQLIGVSPHDTEILRGKDLAKLPILENAWLLAEGVIIRGFGTMKNCPDRADEVYDATDRVLMPTWCDSHTHLVYAGTRETEFVDRIKGLSYEEIANNGGGILNSSKKLEQCSESELFDQSWERLEEVISMGTGAIEIKSGYGLSLENELKMLRVIRKIKEKSPIPVKATFLGAHAFPAKYKNNHKGYIDEIVNEMLPQIAEEGLADYVDAFCEKGYFDIEETTRILEAGVKLSLKPKVHVNQFNSFGAIEACIKNKALSVDHLEVVTKEDIKALQNSQTIATLLPGCSLFISIPYAPARELIDNNCLVSLATDYNPGSAPSGNMNLVVSLACFKMNMLPEEAINAATINAAFAMEVEGELGTIGIGKKASLILTKKISGYSFIPYSFGNNLIEKVFV